MRKTVVLMLVAALPVLGGVFGRLSAPVLSRTHPTVRLGDLLRVPPTEPSPAAAGQSPEAGTVPTPSLDDSDRIDAFRHGGRTKAEVLTESAGVEGRFRTGSVLFGAWCGLVFAFAIFDFHRTRRREIHEIDDAACLACARCFLSCPRERLRRNPDRPDASGPSPTRHVLAAGQSPEAGTAPTPDDESTGAQP